MALYAQQGEKITCPNGHEICTIAEDIKRGDMQDRDRYFKDWQQPIPKVGVDLCIECAECGTPWFNKGIFCIEGRWRL